MCDTDCFPPTHLLHWQERGTELIISCYCQTVRDFNRFLQMLSDIPLNRLRLPPLFWFLTKRRFYVISRVPNKVLPLGSKTNGRFPVSSIWTLKSMYDYMDVKIHMLIPPRKANPAEIFGTDKDCFFCFFFHLHSCAIRMPPKCEAEILGTF